MSIHDTAPAADAVEEAAELKVRLDITIKFKPGQGLADALQSATVLKTIAAEHGAATGIAIIGRQKFPL